MADAPPTIRDTQLLVGDYSAVFAPMLREDRGIGSIMLMRQPPKPFSDKEIALLETFADQAVIAIQNARLFNETKEALERQTATAEVLQVISGSVADTAPVFDKILECCERLLPAASFQLHLVDEAGRLTLERLRWTDRRARHGRRAATRRDRGDAAHGLPNAARRHRRGCVRSAPGIWSSSATCSTIRTCRRQCAWPRSGMGRTFSLAERAADLGRPGHRHDRGHADRGGPIRRRGARAAQDLRRPGVIAIQNARLFNETQAALEQQTATAEVLKVISSSVSDTAPVFDKILESCERLFQGSELGIVLIDEADQQMCSVAFRGAARAAVERLFPLPLRRAAAPSDSRQAGLAFRRRAAWRGHTQEHSQCRQDAGDRQLFAGLRAVAVGKGAASARSTSFAGHRYRSMTRRWPCSRHSPTRR